MIKSGLKNYFSNLKFFFTPLGVLAAGIVIGLSIFIPNAISAISKLSDTLAGIAHEVSLDTQPFKDYVYDAVFTLDWSNPGQTLKSILTADWLRTAVSDCYRLFETELEPYSEEIHVAIDTALKTIKVSFGVLVMFAIIGLICGYLLTGVLVRRNSAKRSFGKFLLSLILGALFTALFISLAIWLALLWTYSIIISCIVAVILVNISALMQSYILYGKRDVRFRDVVNFKNIIQLQFVNILIFVMSIVFTILIVLITNLFVGLLLGFAFIEIAFPVICINADSYVQNLIPAQTEE